MTTIGVKGNSDTRLAARLDGDYPGFAGRQFWNRYVESSAADANVLEFSHRFVSNSSGWMAATDTPGQKEKN